MREILFRGKRVDNGEWVEGDLLQAKHSDGCCSCSIMADTPMAINCQVIPETIGQYTGLTDKNGVKIFEGDIVDSGGGEFGNVIGEVNYNSAHCAFVISHNCGCVKLGVLCSLYIAVIDNIHDNPELLGGES